MIPDFTTAETTAGAIVLFLITLVIDIWGWRVGKRKGRPLVGALLAFFLNLIGILIIYLLPPKRSVEIGSVEVGSAEIG